MTILQIGRCTIQGNSEIAAFRDRMAALFEVKAMSKLIDARPDDFARLFRIHGIGQVLAVTETKSEYDDDEECECVTFRIPDAGDVATLTYFIKAHGMDATKGKAFTRDILEKLTHDNVAKVIQPLVEAKAKLLGEGLIVKGEEA